MHTGELQHGNKVLVRHMPQKVHTLPIGIRNLTPHLIGKNIFPFASAILGCIGPGTITDIVGAHQQHAGTGA